LTTSCRARRRRCCLLPFFFFQAEDGIRDFHVTGVQTCALPIYTRRAVSDQPTADRPTDGRTPAPPLSEMEPWPRVSLCLIQRGRALPALKHPSLPPAGQRKNLAL